VVLKSGGKLKGIIRSESVAQLVIEVAAGTARLNANEVLSVERGRHVLHEYYDREEKAKSAEDFHQLAVWAKENGLSRFARPNLEKAMRLDPSHEGARRGLGYTLHEGRWMTQDELMRARGMVKHEGAWMTPEERQVRLERELEQEKREWAEAVEEERRAYEERRAREDFRRRIPEPVVHLPYGTLYRPNWFWPAYYRPYPYLPYRYKTPPNWWYWPPPDRQGDERADAPTPGSRAFEEAVEREVERRLKEILERMEKERAETPTEGGK